MLATPCLAQRGTETSAASHQVAGCGPAGDGLPVKRGLGAGEDVDLLERR
jgi:hypothetical protein